jgi:hypothetical protein
LRREEGKGFKEVIMTTKEAVTFLMTLLFLNLVVMQMVSCQIKTAELSSKAEILTGKDCHAIGDSGRIVCRESAKDKD